MASELSAKVIYQDKMRFLGQGSGDQAIIIDYPPPLGDDTGLRGGLEMLLMSLAACAGQTVVPLLHKMRQPLETCVIEAHGHRREEHPTILTDIKLKFTFGGKGLDPSALQRAVSLGEEKYCPVWNMLKGTTQITSEIVIAESEIPSASTPMH